MNTIFLLKGISTQWGGYGDMGPGMMYWGYGMSWLWTSINIAFWIAIIVGIIFFIRWMVVSAKHGSREAKSEDSAMEILRQRYAQGEINREEFEEKRKDLEK